MPQGAMAGLKDGPMVPREAHMKPPLGVCPRAGTERVSELYLDLLRSMHVCSGREQGSRTQ